MDKKKLLLVAISVGIFLVIAVGAAILVFAPRGDTPSAVASARNPVSGSQTGITVAPPSSSSPPPLPVSDPAVDASEGLVNSGSGNSGTVPDPVDLVRNPGDVPGLAPPPEGSVRQGDYYVNGAAQGVSANGETVINVPKPSAAAVPDAPPAGRAVSAPRPAPKPVPQAAPKAAPAPAKAPPPEPKIYDDYWVQTGAFSTVAKAEGVKETLASRGITSIIENREVSGQTLFRVRVGPYTSQNEADYWLSLIKTIGGFEESQVRLTQSKR